MFQWVSACFKGKKVQMIFFNNGERWTVTFEISKTKSKLICAAVRIKIKFEWSFLSGQANFIWF